MTDKGLRLHCWRIAIFFIITAVTFTACDTRTDTTTESPETKTLHSLVKVDDHPLYTMTYYGDYPYAEVPSSDRAKPHHKSAWACSLFAALSDADAMLYGRNFDWEHSPALLLFTDSSDGYASVSMVDIAYLDFSDAELSDLTSLPLEKRRPLLNAPLLPFDGMNEYGLAIGMAAVPGSVMPHDPSKTTVGSLRIIREMLEHARTVDEALAVMEKYNIDMEGGPSIHYLIADRAGNAALVEFYQGEMIVKPNETAWHLATNFLLRAVENTSPSGRCGRYDTIEQRLTASKGQLSTVDALDLLRDVSQTGTQWSVVYGMRTGDIDIVMGRAYDDVYTFHTRVTAAPSN